MSLRSKKAHVISYAEALNEAVAQEMRIDPNVFVMGLDVDDHLGILGSTVGLVDEFGADRVFSTPLSEDAMTGVSIGSAMAGLRPIHVHIRMDFLMLCMNQLINIASKAHYMYGGAVNVPMVVRSIIGKSWGQGAQHSQALYSMFAHVPGIRIVAPSNAYDAKGCMTTAIRDNNPVLFVEHRLLYYTEADVPQEQFEVPFGVANICAPGSDVTIVAISNMVIESLRARELLDGIGIDAEIIDPISLVPLDIETIVASVEKTGHLLVVDNAWISCGMSAEIVAQVIQKASTPVRVDRLGFAPVPCPTTPTLEDAFYPNPATIASTAFRLLNPEMPDWAPDPERAALAYQQKFRGPF